MNIHNNAELLHSRLQLVLDTVHYFAKWSEVPLESSQDRKALKSKVEVTLGSKHWPSYWSSQSKLTFSPLNSDHTVFYY